MKKLLVVDDMPENLRLLRKLLAPKGYEVSEAGTAEAALEALAGGLPDVLMADLRLGEGRMTGYDLAARVRALPGGRGVVLLAFSGGAQFDDDSAVPATGFDGFIQKPFDFAALASQLEGFLERKKGEGLRP